MHNEDVLICTLVCRRTAYVLDLFLANQHEIQLAYPNCRLILATDEADYAFELRELIIQQDINGDVITYKSIKPEYAKSHIWNITCGREALREKVISCGTKYLMFMDADMTYDPNVIGIIKSEINGFDVIYSGFRVREGYNCRLGGGCTVINSKTLNKISFNCREFKNGQVIDEFELLDVELFRCGAHVKKGIFFANRHYKSRNEYFEIQPGQLSWIRKMTNSLLVRYLLVKLNILFQRNITQTLYNFSRNTPTLDNSKDV